MRRVEKSDGARGFTLMELLVSMTIISLLALTIMFGWRIAAGAWGRANELVEEQRRVAAIDQVLQMQMAEMTALSPWRRQGNLSVFFQGERQTARFLSRYSLVNRSRSGLYRIEYQIADADNGRQQLLLNEIPIASTNDLSELLPDAKQGAEGGVRSPFLAFERTEHTRVLLDDISGAGFEYYRPTGPWGQGGWVTEWPEQRSELPRAMAIRFTAKDVPNRLQPVSVVARIENYSRARP